MKKIGVFFILLLFSYNANLIACNIPPWIVFINIYYIPQPNQENTNIIINTSADKIIKLRIKKEYEVYNAKGKIVLKGSGKEIDISELPDGKYTVKFEKDFNQIEYFRKYTLKSTSDSDIK